MGSPRLQSPTLLLLIGVVKGVRAYIEADIVKNDLSLLLNHKSIKTAGMLLDFKNDSCWIFGRYVKLLCMMPGHYSLPRSTKIHTNRHIHPKGQCSWHIIS